MVSYRTALGVAIVAVAWAALASHVHADGETMTVSADGKVKAEKPTIYWVGEGEECRATNPFYHWVCSENLRCLDYLTQYTFDKLQDDNPGLDLTMGVKRCFKTEDVVDNPITLHEALVWGYTATMDPHYVSIKLGKRSAVQGEAWKEALRYGFYCPIPGKREGPVCGSGYVCNLQHKCQEIEPKDGDEGKALVFTTNDLKTTEEVSKSQCLLVFQMGNPRAKPVDSKEWPGLKDGAAYCIQRSLEQYCHPQLPFACGKGLYCKHGQCVEEPIKECFHGGHCRDKNGVCGFPTEDFPLEGEILNGKVCCREKTTHYQPLHKDRKIVSHAGQFSKLGQDNGLEVCGDESLVHRHNCRDCMSGSCRDGHCLHDDWKGVGERCVGDDANTKTSMCITTCEQLGTRCNHPGYDHNLDPYGNAAMDMCHAVGCFMNVNQECVQNTCSTTPYMPLPPATLPKVIPHHVSYCPGQCYPWLSFQREFQPPGSTGDTWTTNGDGVWGEKCRDPEDQLNEYSLISPTVLQLPAGSPCVPQRPSRLTKPPSADNADKMCLDNLLCYEMRDKTTTDEGTKERYLGYGCCLPKDKNDGTWEQHKATCRKKVSEDWFKWRRVAKDKPHYYYQCQSGGPWGYWYLYSEDKHREFVKCPGKAVTTVNGEPWCVLPRYWPCKEDHQCESKKCLNTGESMTRYGKIFQCGSV